MPLPPASSSSDSVGFWFSFSGFLGGPPKKSPMPFCQVGVGRGHTAFPPAYLFFAVEQTSVSVASCTVGVQLWLWWTWTHPEWTSGHWTTTTRWPNWTPVTYEAQMPQQLENKMQQTDEREREKHTLRRTDSCICLDYDAKSANGYICILKNWNILNNLDIFRISSARLCIL